MEDTTMTRRPLVLLIALALSFLMAPLAGEAPLAVKIPRIGFLSLQSPSDPGMPRHLAAFRQGLHELGWAEGQNITIERRYAEGDAERLSTLATELVRVPVDVMVTAGLPAALAAKQATTTIPIVMAVVSDPVGRGLVASLARPGGNITGFSFETTPEVRGKQLQLLKEAVPTVSRVAILWGPREVASQAYGKAGADAARALGITLRSVRVQRAEDLAWAFAVITSDPIGIHALMVAGPLGYMHRRQIADFARQRGLPTMGELREFVEAGGLMSYGISLTDQHRRTAYYVDKILKGAKPADLPVEQPTKFELVLNLKTAEALGLTIPPALLFQADEVIR
jgi:putative ABC transport system substrate-binding protein